MRTEILNQSELLVLHSRRQLWVSLGLILLMGIAALALNFDPESNLAVVASKLFVFFPVFIVMAIAALRRPGMRSDPADPAMKMILSDELRQTSLQRAYRNGFFVMLFAQPLLGLGLTVFAVNTIWLACFLSLLAGALVFLASVLYYDR